jgi:hypothetical protein
MTSPLARFVIRATGQFGSALPHKVSDHGNERHHERQSKQERERTIQTRNPLAEFMYHFYYPRATCSPIGIPD